jgi:hypothetical protein
MGKAKLLGIEIFRGISTYAVILVHSGDETWHLPISEAAIEFRHHFYFAASSFLTAVFSFMVASPKIGYSLIVLSIFMYSLLEASGNALQLGPDIAFKGLLDSWQINAENYPLLRVMLVELSWFIECLPYFY